MNGGIDKREHRVGNDIGRDYIKEDSKPTGDYIDVNHSEESSKQTEEDKPERSFKAVNILVYIIIIIVLAYIWYVGYQSVSSHLYLHELDKAVDKPIYVLADLIKTRVNL